MVLCFETRRDGGLAGVVCYSMTCPEERFLVIWSWASGDAFWLSLDGVCFLVNRMWVFRFRSQGVVDRVECVRDGDEHAHGALEYVA